LLQQLNDGQALVLTRCRQCHGQFLRDPVNGTGLACPTCRLKKNASRRRRPAPGQASTSSIRSAVEETRATWHVTAEPAAQASTSHALPHLTIDLRASRPRSPSGARTLWPLRARSRIR
jgi:hypothetical protein